MKTIDDKISELFSGGWSEKYYLINDNDESLIKLTKAKVNLGNLSFINDFELGNKCRIICIILRTDNRTPRLIYEMSTRHISLDKNKEFNAKLLALNPSSSCSNYHIKLIMKDLFKNSTHGYLTSEIASSKHLVREIEISKIDTIISNNKETDIPTSVDDIQQYVNENSSDKCMRDHSINYILLIYNMYLREIKLGLKVDQELFSKMKEALENNKVI
jgi:hypothetical protein